MNAVPQPHPRVLIAEFIQPEALLAAIRSLRARGFSHLRTCTPFPLDELPEALGLKPSPVPWIVLVGGLLGGMTGYGMEYYAAVVDYPINVGGRPLHSWPAFIPITFELTVLGAVLAGLLGLLFCSGLPRLHHPQMNAAAYSRSTVDRFLLYVTLAHDADPQPLHAILTEFNATSIDIAPGTEGPDA